MPRSPDAFLHWVKSVAQKSYYEILRVPNDAAPAQIKQAFHAFGLSYHPDRYAEETPEVAAAAAEVFKRGVEAYRVLSRPALRARYDKSLAQGQKRFDEKKIEEKPPPPTGKTLEQVAKGPKAKQFALKADRLLSIGKLEDARLQLVNACQHEPDNQELAERLNLIYEALALEPL
jgi:curved DNA-binding protein CbpA